MKKRGRPHHPDILTPRQWEVLALIRDNLSNQEIAERIGISQNGVKFHVSEILTKLGVRSRLEASRWQPPRPGALGLLGAVIPLVLWRKLNWLSQGIAGGLGIAITAGLGLLIWGLLVTQNDGPAVADIVLGAQEGEVLDGASVVDGFGLWLFDTETESATRLPVDERLMLAQWLEDGTKFVAYAIDQQAWRIYDVEGNALGTFLQLPEGDGPRITAHVRPTSEGTALLVLYDLPEGKSMAIIDIATHLEQPFESLQGVNEDPMFSPDGLHLAYTNKSGDLTSVVVAEPDGANATAIRVVSNPDNYIFPVAWSPDGTSLLVQLGLFGASCGSGCRAFATRSFEVLNLSGEVVWSFDASRLTDVQWAGAERVFVGQPQVTTLAGETLHLSAKFFETADGSFTSAPLELADSCCTSLSPDGQRAVVRKKTGVAGQQCMLIEAASGNQVASIGDISSPRDAPCASVSWTSDSIKALVSSSGS